MAALILECGPTSTFSLTVANFFPQASPVRHVSEGKVFHGAWPCRGLILQLVFKSTTPEKTESPICLGGGNCNH